jgi:biotin transporter BioY
MAKGQKMIIWAIALYFPIVGSSSAMPRGAPASLAVLFLAAFVGIIVLSLVGVLRLSRGLGIPLALRILFGVMIFVPLLNILILALLSSQATKSLRKAGYRVGFFGASKPA